MNKSIETLLNQSSWYFGTSSWKYPGWKGLIYKSSYTTDKNFQDTCLKEYASHFSCVGVDHTYYSWPTTKVFFQYVEQTPPEFKFVLKATEKVTVLRYPKLPRYGKEAGLINTSFLNAELFEEKFIEPLRPFKDRIGPIMFEFSQFFPNKMQNDKIQNGTFQRGSEFVEKLDLFLGRLKKISDFKFAVEIRNSNWLQPAYFECLVKNHVGHVFNSWTRMPQLSDQLEKAHAFKLPFVVSRLLLSPGTLYQDAVDSFSPYDKLHQELNNIRNSVVDLLLWAKQSNVPAFILVNNRFEGCAPKTLEGIFSIIESKNQ